MAFIDRYSGDLALLVGLLAATRIRFLPREITALEFVPFCSLTGGLAGAYWRALMDRESGFPLRESFHGAALGALFGLLFIVFGASHA